MKIDIPRLMTVMILTNYLKVAPFELPAGYRCQENPSDDRGKITQKPMINQYVKPCFPRQKILTFSRL
jgi:hypothetical protein